MGSSTLFNEITCTNNLPNTITIYFYSEERPTLEGNYFYIVNCEAVEWINK